MITVSLCMIVKNEEKVLGRCLDSAKRLVDEIIIVDTGSVDATKKIAAEYTRKIYDFKWIDDFSAARNFSFSKASMDYIFWLDADDEISKEQADKFIELKEKLSMEVDMVTMLYDTAFDSYGKPLMTSTRERLVKRDRAFRWIDPVHECIPLSENIYYSDIRISHKKEKTDGISHRNIKIYEKMEIESAVFTPRQLYYYAREFFDHSRYEKSAEYLKLFLEGGQGWKEDNIAACVLLAKCYGNLNEQEKMLSSLVKSFEYDSPRPEACCELGYFYKRKNDFKTAIKWFETALNAQYGDSIGFVQEKFSAMVPHLELCVCYYGLGDIKKAIFHNNMAAGINENDKSVIYNNEFFAKSTGERNREVV